MSRSLRSILGRPFRNHACRFTANLVAIATVMVCESSLFAQAPQSAAAQSNAAGMTDEQRAEEMVEKLRYLVRSQQKIAVRKLIEQYPNTHLAKIGRELLADLELYDAIAEQDFLAREADKSVIRAYWDARRPSPPVAPLNPVVITNRSDETVLYQVKWRGVEWLGPYHIAPGQTHEFNDALVFRRVTREGTDEYSLSLGQRYIFVRPAAGAVTNLYQESR